MKSLAKTLKEETQATRGIWNYLRETYDKLDGHWFEFEERRFNSYEEFLKEIIDCCEHQLAVAE